MNENPTTTEEQCELGLCYAKGDGVPRSTEETIYWFKKTANQGYEPSQYRLGLSYMDGTYRKI